MSYEIAADYLEGGCGRGSMTLDHYAPGSVIGHLRLPISVSALPALVRALEGIYGPGLTMTGEGPAEQLTEAWITLYMPQEGT